MRSTDCEWWVYSTAVYDGVIMVRCAKTKAEGYIENYTRAEWKAAYYAPSKNYRWRDNSRVVLKPNSVKRRN